MMQLCVFSFQIKVGDTGLFRLHLSKVAQMEPR